MCPLRGQSLESRLAAQASVRRTSWWSDFFISVMKRSKGEALFVLVLGWLLCLAGWVAYLYVSWRADAESTAFFFAFFCLPISVVALGLGVVVINRYYPDPPHMSEASYRWRRLRWAFALGVVLFGATFFIAAMGGGHGVYEPLIVTFPWALALARFGPPSDGAGIAMMSGVAATQFPLYVLLLGEPGRWFKARAVTIVLVHVVAAALLVAQLRS